MKDTKFDINEIKSLIPENVSETVSKLLCDNKFYCISFKK